VVFKRDSPREGEEVEKVGFYEQNKYSFEFTLRGLLEFRRLFF